MKHILITFTLLLATITVFSQAPQQFNYQAIARDLAGQPLADQNIGIRISILQEDINGSAVYQEIHLVQTSGQGLFNLSIGGGSAVIGDMTDVDWGGSTHFLQTEIDTDGGSNFELLGTSQLLSVPYALYANTSTPQELSIDGNELSISGGNSVEISGGESFWMQGDSSIYYDVNPIFVGRRYSIIDSTLNANSIHANLSKVAPVNISTGQLSGFSLSDSPVPGINFYGEGEENPRVNQLLVNPRGGFAIASEEYGFIEEGTLLMPNSILTGSIRTQDINGPFQVGQTSVINTTSDIYFKSSSSVVRGLILQSPNGKCWKQTVDDNGNFQSEEVSCPN